jgi:hypothetical protein
MTAWAKVQVVLLGLFYVVLATWFGVATPLAIAYLWEH